MLFERLVHRVQRGLSEHVVRGGLGTTVRAGVLSGVGATQVGVLDVGHDLLAELAGFRLRLVDDLLHLGVRGDVQGDQGLGVVLLERRCLDLPGGLVVGEVQVRHDLAVLPGLCVRHRGIGVDHVHVAVAAEHEVDILRVQLRRAGLNRVVDEGDDHVGLLLILQLLRFLIHLLGGVGEVQAGDIVRAGLALGQVGGGAHQRNLHAVNLDDLRGLQVAGAVLLEHVRAELDVTGTRVDAVNQVLVALIKLVVASSGAHGANGLDKVHGVFVVRDRGDERRAALVIARAGDDSVGVLVSQEVDDAGDVCGTHLVALLRGDLARFLVRGQVRLEAAVEVGEVSDANLHLLIVRCKSRDSGDHQRGRRSCGDQRAGATERKHLELLCV